MAHLEFFGMNLVLKAHILILFYFREQIEITWDKVRRIRWMLQDLELDAIKFKEVLLPVLSFSHSFSFASDQLTYAPAIGHFSR